MRSPSSSLRPFERLLARVARLAGLGRLTKADYALIPALCASDLARSKRALLLGAIPHTRARYNPLGLALLQPGAAPAVELLLDAGADPNAWSHFPESPIHAALSRGQWEAAWLLISRARSPLAPSPEGQSVLGSALLSFYDRHDDYNPELPDALSRLLRLGADLDAPCRSLSERRALSPGDSEAPAFLAACFLAGKKGRGQPALALLAEGANPFGRGSNGQGAASFFFWGLRESHTAHVIGLSLNASQRELLASLAEAGLGLCMSATLAGFGQKPQAPCVGAELIWPVVHAISRSVQERRDMDSLIERGASSPSKPAPRL